MLHTSLIIPMLALALGANGAPEPAAATTARLHVVSNSDDYFPDRIGNRWEYRGQIIKTPLQAIKKETFINVSTVTGTETIQGVKVKVFHDTNPGNHGPQHSYYRRDAAGIVYYGSRPGTDLERQVIPYQVVMFPLKVPSSFQQFDRRGLLFGADLDGDGVDETADLKATVSVDGMEQVTVPAGTYDEAIRVVARMMINIHLSSTGRIAVGRDTMTAWFAKGVGLIKYIELQELPGIRRGLGRSTEILEELLNAKVELENASFERGESSTEGIFAHDSGNHELNEIVFPASLGANP